MIIPIAQLEQNRAPPLREFICERLWCIRVHAENGERFAEIGDDVGLGYSLRGIIAHFRAARASFIDLREEERARRAK